MDAPNALQVRDYTEADAAPTLTIFTDAIMTTAAADYSVEQRTAWATPGERDLTRWHRSLADRGSFVVLVEGEVAGFADVASDGYVDMLFVAPAWGGRGVARVLLTEAERRAREAGARELTANVSITARPVFERRGFVATRTQQVARGDVTLANFRMHKPL